MAEEYKCEKCEKGFQTSDALAMHAQAKHPEEHKKPHGGVFHKNKKNIRNWTIALLTLALIVWGITALIKSGGETNRPSVDLPEASLQNIPRGPVHWHPKLTVKINGERVPIPKNIGISIGKVVDTHLSSMRMSPTHTHESDGTIHLENNNPSGKPETLSLGYFFYVWEKTFNATCIFAHCGNSGVLKMYVNGQENQEFERYIMRDKDDIRIEYTSSG